MVSEIVLPFIQSVLQKTGMTILLAWAGFPLSSYSIIVPEQLGNLFPSLISLTLYKNFLLRLFQHYFDEGNIQ